jgi:hypothetical protein
MKKYQEGTANKPQSNQEFKPNLGNLTIIQFKTVLGD